MIQENIKDTQKTVNFSVNGTGYSESSPEILEDTLLNYIRGILKLTDVKCGCEKGFCGSCTVMINGSAQKSCARKIKNLQGAVIETPAFINSPSLSRFSEMLDRHGAVQCGFCFPGITCSLESKLKNVEKPSRKEVADALAGHICRCTGYVPIIEAAAGEGIARGRESDNAFKNICRSPVREDSASKLNGSALYADDLQFENMLHVHVLRSAHARA
ncbi:MAG TPA: 2Fe-2S iron-sulfur cluster-binding protein, partial [Candidatus Wallbacteria bacterium]|nr:2Fe-2S iron-sulfur cluster-binding protein [Candidatus Wallbacteria bacterium]